MAWVHPPGPPLERGGEVGGRIGLVRAAIGSISLLPPWKGGEELWGSAITWGDRTSGSSPPLSKGGPGGVRPNRMEPGRRSKSPSPQRRMINLQGLLGGPP